MAIAKLDRYRDMLLNLLPEGLAWAKNSGSTLSKFVEGAAKEFVRADDFLEKEIIDQIDPRSATHTLEAWEEFVGLPIACDPFGSDNQTLREKIISRLRAQGGQSKEFYQSVFDGLGIKAEIFSFQPFRMGSRMGDRLNNASVWNFSWGVQVQGGDIVYFRMGSRMGDRLREYRHPFLECLLDEMNLAHRSVLIFPSGQNNIQN